MLPEEASSLLVLAHGAGAGMAHRFMESLSWELASVGVGTFRYQFPYMERGNRRPDPPATLTESVRFAVKAATNQAPGISLLAGGKSMGGRMTSLAASQAPLAGVEGLVFFGFPLHAPGKPATERAKHLNEILVPMLFLQGSRDAFAELTLLRPILSDLGHRATLHVVQDADHSFHMLKRSGKTDAGVLSELAAKVEEWDRRIGSEGLN